MEVWPAGCSWSQCLVLFVSCCLALPPSVLWLLRLSWFMSITINGRTFPSWWLLRGSGADGSGAANLGSSLWLLLHTVCLQFGHLSHFTYLSWKKGLCKRLLLIPCDVFLPLVPPLLLLCVISYRNSTKLCQIRWMLLSSSEVMLPSDSIWSWVGTLK